MRWITSPDTPYHIAPLSKKMIIDAQTTWASRIWFRVGSLDTGFAPGFTKGFRAKMPIGRETRIRGPAG